MEPEPQHRNSFLLPLSHLQTGRRSCRSTPTRAHIWFQHVSLEVDIKTNASGLAVETTPGFVGPLMSLHYTVGPSGLVDSPGVASACSKRSNSSACPATGMTKHWWGREKIDILIDDHA